MLSGTRGGPVCIGFRQPCRPGSLAGEACLCLLLIPNPEFQLSRAPPALAWGSGPTGHRPCGVTPSRVFGIAFPAAFPNLNGSAGPPGKGAPKANGHVRVVPEKHQIWSYFCAVPSASFFRLALCASLMLDTLCFPCRVLCSYWSSLGTVPLLPLLVSYLSRRVVTRSKAGAAQAGPEGGPEGGPTHILKHDEILLRPVFVFELVSCR